MSMSETKILFIPYYLNISLDDSDKERILSALKNFRSVGVISVVQYVNEQEKIKKFLEENNIKAFTGGKILGCDISNAAKIKDNVDVFLYLGSGKFHPINAAAQLEKKVFVYDPCTKSLSEISSEETASLKRKRLASIAKASAAKIYGILVTLKDKQFKLKEAIELKEKIEKADKKAYIFAGNEINCQNLIAFSVDAWINTACPRIAEDDLGKPVINPEEMDYIL